MPVVTEQELIDAAEDAATLEKVVNDPHTATNPGQADGTVTSRLGAVYRNVQKVLHDLDNRVEIASVGGALTAQQLSTETIAAAVTNIVTAGGARYVRSATEPSHAGKFQSADGAWWSLVYDGFVTPQMFNAAADGTTDDSLAMQNALDYLNSIGGGTLRILGDTIRCDSKLIGYSDTSIVGDAGATIDWSQRGSPLNSPGDDGLLVFRGTAGTEILLTADVAYGDNRITVPDASLFSEGDLVEVSMNAEGSFPDTSVATKSGQLNIVTGVYTGSNGLILDTAILEPLGHTTANGARVRKITPVDNVTLTNVTFKGTGRPLTNVAGDLGVRVFFGRNTTIRNCTFVGLDTKELEVIGCYQWLIDNNEFIHDKIGNTNSKVNYAVSFSSSMYGTISNNKIINARHGIVSSHLSAALTNDYYGISRFINIVGNHITGNYGELSTSGWTIAHAGIATHSDCEFITITNNYVSGCRHGINPRTWNISILNNDIVHCAAAGIYLSEDYRDIRIEGNRITGTVTSIVGVDDATKTRHNIIIKDNEMRNSGSIALFASTSTVSEGLIITGNRMVDYDGASSIGVLILDGRFTGEVSRNYITNATIPGIRLEATVGVTLSENFIYKTLRPINVNSNCDRTIVIDNKFISNTNNMIANATSNSIVSGNSELGSGVL